MTANSSSKVSRVFVNPRVKKFINDHLAIVLVLALIVIWSLGARYANIPAYKLPPPGKVLEEGWNLIKNGELPKNIWSSVYLLIYSSAIGIVLAIPMGIGIALNKYIAGFFQPLVVFFQSIAGVAWVPLAIIWFGFGKITVSFVVANGVFFIVLFNTMTGVMTIPQNLRHVVKTLGGSEWNVLVQVILPGALVNILGGLRIGLAFGWRALVAAEMISSAQGLGFMTLDAAQYFKSATILVGIFVIGSIWLLMDRLILQPIENRTVRRWGLIKHYEE